MLTTSGYRQATPTSDSAYCIYWLIQIRQPELPILSAHMSQTKNMRLNERTGWRPTGC